MAREFDVTFLGAVPVDGQWGSLVEEGKRPRYGGNVANNNGDDDDDDDDDELVINERGMDVSEGNDGAGNRRLAQQDDGLLVDKYRSCSLCTTFEKITSQVIRLVESRHGNDT